MTPLVIVGIDPGLTGAIAIINAATGALIDVVDMPTMPTTKGKHDISAPLLADLLRHERIHLAVVEQVHSMPRQGVASSFKFGLGYGTILGVLGTIGAPIRHVTPQQWKKAMRVTADKGTARTRATETWPASAHLFARAKDDGRAEAALIARWGWENLTLRPVAA